MPTKNDLAAFAGEKPQPPLRRGRGVRLSRAPKQSPSIEAGAHAKALDRVETPPAEQPQAAAASVASPPEPIAAVSIPDTIVDAPHKPAREKRKLQLRKDLLKECKRIARGQDRKLYQVIESALEEYIQRHGAR